MQAGNWSNIRIRTAFISDLHLGTRDCQADEVCRFLTGVDMEELFLVGDVVDLWSMRGKIFWPAAHHEVLRLVMEKIRRGTRVIYIPGNHDDLARTLVGSLLAGIEVHEEFSYTTRNGRRMLVIHGDVFDGAVRFSPLLKATGCALYGVIMVVNRQVNLVRGLLGMRRWSMATWLKSRVGNAMAYVRRYELAAAAAAKARGFDGIICGHIHRPHVEEIDGVLYCNDGDWVEHCTALIEDRNGELRLWQHRMEELEPLVAAQPASLGKAA
ncbi:MAG TPA: UDP-2,3-diacylglucosamine diphosphatase [Steroidobacteraceae bacterium]|nr:UDP-2,3-diacylglucosamine diphosphatase [Steroidobacteraceae bacterium]